MTRILLFSCGYVFLNERAYPLGLLTRRKGNGTWGFESLCPRMNNDSPLRGNEIHLESSIEGETLLLCCGRDLDDFPGLFTTLNADEVTCGLTPWEDV